MKRILSVLLAACMAVCGGIAAFPALAAETLEPDIILIVQTSGGVIITPFASESISTWSRTLSRSGYGAVVTLKASYSGTAVVELHNNSGLIDSFDKNFTNERDLVLNKSRSQASGSYKIIVKITINGSTTIRESTFSSI